MKAIILAGGRGERLRPITDDIPKPLVPILARPVMDYTLSLLSHHGIKRATVTTRFLAERIRETYKEGKFGVRLEYTEEKTPLGTAGSVGLCRKDFRDEKDFLVISGDAVCDFDLTKAIEFHREKEALATVILSSVSKPLEYGVCISDGEGRIVGFSEKPDWSEALSDLVNTGVYIFSGEIFSYIPENEEYDFAKDLFPKLLSENKKIYGYKDDGYWCDIGKIPEYYRCNLDMLNSRFVSHMAPIGEIRETATGRYFVSDTAFVDEKAVINENTVISDGVNIEKGANVSGSIIMKGCEIGERTKVFDSILCESVKISKDASVVGEAVIGEESVADEGARVAGGLHRGGTYFEPRIPFSDGEGFVFTEKGAEGASGFLDGEETEKLGNIFGSVSERKVIVTYDREKKESEVFAELFSTGVVKAGRDVLFAGPGDADMTSFLSYRHSYPSAYVTEVKGRARITLFESDSLPITRKTAIRISRGKGVVSEKFGTKELLSGAEDEYVEAVKAECGKGNGREFGFFGTKRSELLAKAVMEAGFGLTEEKKEGVLSVSVFGDGLEVFFGRERFFDTPRARLFVINEMLSEGRRKFCLPDNSPTVFFETVKRLGGEVRTFSLGYTGRDEKEVRLTAAKERWTFDPLFLGAKIISYASRIEKEMMRNVLERTPLFYISTIAYYPDEDTRLKLVCRAKKEIETDKVRIFPTARVIRIISEASSFEAALDNAFEFRGKLYEIEQKIKGR